MRNFNFLSTSFGLIIAVFILAVSFTYIKAQEEKSAESDALTVELDAVNDSGVSGTVTLTPVDNKTEVVINLTGAPEGVAQPVHIHQGTCQELGAPKYPLEAIENGKSETTIDAKLSDLTTEDLAINVHKSKEEISTYVACGEIPKS